MSNMQPTTVKVLPVNWGKKSTETLHDKFWRQVEKRSKDECWPWNGTTIRDGRGVLWNGEKNITAPRAALIVSGVDVPDGLFVCHHCDNPNCVNPSHLFIGTARQNLQDASSKKRLRGQRITECPKGHPLSGENLFISSNGRRTCRICLDASKRKYERLRLANRKVDALREALRRVAFVDAQGTRFCGVCGWVWEAGQPELHAPGCLAAQEVDRG